MISLIFAVNLKNVIGSKGQIPWHIPEELKYFKEITIDSAIVMGRLTWESLPIKPLPRRKNIVLSRQPIESFDVKPHLVCDSIAKVLTLNEDIFVIGGEQPLMDALPMCDRIYRTVVHDHSDGDTFGPMIDETKFAISQKTHTSSNGIQYVTQVLQRLKTE